MSILLRIRHHHETKRNDRLKAELAQTDHTPTTTSATPAGDQRKLRGIPAIGRGVTGAIQGSIPHANALPTSDS